jgi:hypothetical protein
MAHQVFRHLVPATLVLIACHGAASAQRASGPDITGRWLFQTGKFDTLEYRDGCVMSGEITIRSTPSSSVHACSFTIETLCKQDGREAEYYRVQQSCAATKIGAKVMIASKIDAIVETRLDGRPVRLGGYTADMFDLELLSGGNEMTGHQYDAVRRVPARFWRDQELVS